MGAISTTIDSGYGAAVQARGLRFYSTLCCVISRAINTSPCFRHRIVDDVLDDYGSIRGAIDAARARPHQDFRGGLDGRFFLTHLPWLSFTGIQHPYTPASGSIPLISTGCTFQQDGKEMLPIAMQVT